MDIDKEIDGLKIKTESIEKESKGNASDIFGYIFILVFLVAVIFLLLTKNSEVGLMYISKAKLWLSTIL